MSKDSKYVIQKRQKATFYAVYGGKLNHHFSYTLIVVKPFHMLPL
jgi:hypothetical protein